MARGKEQFRNLSGSEKAAIFMLSLDQGQSAQLFSLMDEEEIKELS
ncbi:MAG: flagellar motor switch protein FliG, partial [Rhodospirillales bacterium]|nr:flagellar motor switch protein FliG [Rhodospirillales bacterium]